MKPHIWLMAGLWQCDPYRMKYEAGITMRDLNQPCGFGDTPEEAYKDLKEWTDSVSRAKKRR